MIINSKVLKTWCGKTIFTPSFDVLSSDDWKSIEEVFKTDCLKYFEKVDDNFCLDNIKYYPGLLATLFYRISRYLYINNKEYYAKEFSSVGFSLTGCEIYYSAKIGSAFKINHTVGTVIGARVELGDNVLLHQGITLGDKKGGRPSIGNNVIIYANSTVVGAIDIGDNVIIGANCFIDKSLESNSVYGRK